MGEGVTEITVTVSGGPEIIIMIDLTDMEYPEAYQTLREMGLKPQVPTYEYDEEIQENHIISYTPLEGAVLPRDRGGAGGQPGAGDAQLCHAQT